MLADKEDKNRERRRVSATGQDLLRCLKQACATLREAAYLDAAAGEVRVPNLPLPCNPAWIICRVVVLPKSSLRGASPLPLQH